MGLEIVILVIHCIIALAIIGVVLLQPPENSSLGGLGGSNPMAGMTGGRGQGNILTRATAILATIFIITSLVLAILAGNKPPEASILDLATTPPVSEAVPEKAPAKAPAVPLSK